MERTVSRFVILDSTVFYVPLGSAGRDLTLGSTPGLGAAPMGGGFNTGLNVTLGLKIGLKPLGKYK